MIGNKFPWRSSEARRRGLRTLCVGLFAFVTAPAAAADLNPADIEFFETHIRPVFIQQCYECHSESIQAKGGLRLDTAAGIVIGGQRGPLIVPGKPDESLLIKALRQEGKAVEGRELEIAGVDVNPAGLLPHDTSYYTYMGSLTAPPCTEGVTWFVMKAPMEISAEEISAFAKLYPHDVRPVQPLNGRIVKEGQ